LAEDRISAVGRKGARRYHLDIFFLRLLVCAGEIFAATRIGQKVAEA